MSGFLERDACKVSTMDSTLLKEKCDAHTLRLFFPLDDFGRVLVVSRFGACSVAVSDEDFPLLPWPLFFALVSFVFGVGDGEEAEFAEDVSSRGSYASASEEEAC